MRRVRAGGALTTLAAVAAVVAPPAHAATLRIDVGVLLPETTTSTRWATQDARYLRAAMRERGLRATVVNAHGSTATQHAQATAALDAGAKVLVLAGVAARNGAASSASDAIVREAHARGAKVVAYDRFTPAGLADYYVSFDDARVGILQGRALAKCIREQHLESPLVAELDGAPIFAQGYDAELAPLLRSGRIRQGPDQQVPDWDAAKARTIFAAMLDRTGDQVGAVVAGNDNIASAVIAVLHARGLPQVPIAGQDATIQGLRHILAGDQCMTVLKSPRLEAASAADAALGLFRGRKPSSSTLYAETVGARRVPSTLLRPVTIAKSTIGRVLKDGSVTRARLCAGSYAALCEKAGI